VATGQKDATPEDVMHFQVNKVISFTLTAAAVIINTVHGLFRNPTRPDSVHSDFGAL